MISIPTFVTRPDGRMEPIEAWLDRNLEKRRAERPKRSRSALSGWLTRRAK